METAVCSCYLPTPEWMAAHDLTACEHMGVTTAVDSTEKRQMQFVHATGELWLYIGVYRPVNRHDDHVFHGYLPNEEALNQVIAWTRWQANA